LGIFDDLLAEQDRLEGLLAGLDERQWASPSGAAGWSLADVVLHLAQSEEAVTASVAAAHEQPDGPAARMAGRPADVTVDEFATQAVQAERADGASVLWRW
jgi:uncharacterized protein (TIGR03083 family)